MLLQIGGARARYETPALPEKDPTGQLEAYRVILEHSERYRSCSLLWRLAEQALAGCPESVPEIKPEPKPPLPVRSELFDSVG